VCARYQSGGHLYRGKPPRQTAEIEQQALTQVMAAEVMAISYGTTTW
jgi:hypothetical protein